LPLLDLLGTRLRFFIRMFEVASTGDMSPPTLNALSATRIDDHHVASSLLKTIKSRRPTSHVHIGSLGNGRIRPEQQGKVGVFQVHNRRDPFVPMDQARSHHLAVIVLADRMVVIWPNPGQLAFGVELDTQAAVHLTNSAKGLFLSLPTGCFIW
jgi:hypothetical protein